MYFNEEITKVIDRLHTDPKRGLEDEEIHRRREQHGWNKLEEEKKKSIVTLFLQQLNDPLIYILLIAAAISGFMGGME